MARVASKSVTKKVAVKRPHFSVRRISNRTPRGFRNHRAGRVFARIFSF